MCRAKVYGVPSCGGGDTLVGCACCGVRGALVCWCAGMDQRASTLLRLVCWAIVTRQAR